jgi:hypothetical protein
MTGSSLMALLREEFPRVHPAFRMVDLTMQSTLIDNTLTRDRALALLSAFFSIVVIVLVGVGLYAVLSYSVVLRTPELGSASLSGLVRRKSSAWWFPKSDW